MLIRSQLPYVLACAADMMCVCVCVCVCVLCNSDVEVGPDATDRRLMDQHLSADYCCRQKQRSVAVHDSTILTACLRASHAGMYDSVRVSWASALAGCGHKTSLPRPSPHE